MRKALELLTTAQPAAANCGSSSRAMPASRAAKITRGAPSGEALDTGIWRTRCRDGRLQPPAYGVAIALPGRAVGSGQPCHLEPGMGFEHLDEALADNSGSAKNSD